MPGGGAVFNAAVLPPKAMNFKSQLTAAFNQCRHWASSPEPDAYYADAAALVNALSVQARREGAGHLAERWELCSPSHAMSVFGRMLAWIDKPAVMTVKQAAEALGICERLARDLIATGKLGHHRVGHGRGRIRISPRDIEQYQSRAVRPAFRHFRLHA